MFICLMSIKSCEPPPCVPDLYYWWLRNLHLSKRCEGQCRKGLSAEDASNAYHSLSSSTGWRQEWRRARLQGTSGSFCDFGVDVVAHHIQTQGKAGMSPKLYIFLLSPFFSLKMFLPTLSEVSCVLFKVSWAQRLRGPPN